MPKTLKYVLIGVAILVVGIVVYRFVKSRANTSIAGGALGSVPSNALGFVKNVTGLFTRSGAGTVPIPGRQVVTNTPAGGLNQKLGSFFGSINTPPSVS